MNAAAQPKKLPSGLVTFVLTDIEGSTRLFRQLGDDYPSLLADHYDLLRAAVAGHGGTEVGTEGDSLLVAFLMRPRQSPHVWTPSWHCPPTFGPRSPNPGAGGSAHGRGDTG